MKKAFTLAEVLITLMIIGIVAALTIPSVISNYQQQEYKTGLKKAVSVLNEAIQMNISQEGETPHDRGGGDGTEDNKGRLDLYLMRHMSIIKSVYGTSNGNGAARVNGKWQGAAKNHAFYTTDGMRFEIPEDGAYTLDRSNVKLHESGINMGSSSEYNRGGNFAPCGSYGLSKNANNTTETPCFILVDINGDKKPTIYGANVTIASDAGSVKQNYVYPAVSDKKFTDIFPILITDEKAIPFGVVAQRAMYSK